MEAVIVSHALDTNGQNARYAKASQKWGTHAGVLKALAIGHYDPASVIGRYAALAEKTDFLRIRSVHRATHIYQQMPADIIWTWRNYREIRELAWSADIIHLNNSTMAYRRLHVRHGTPTLLHHHGSLFRRDPAKLMREAAEIRATQCVSTVDLMQPNPELLHWMPTAYDIDWLEAFGKAHRRQPNGVLRVVQCPTDLGPDYPYKSTAVLRKAVDGLRAQGMNIELVVVRDTPWIDAMAIKATADVYFDQVKLGYGCNAVEAWGMGIPVIAGADEWTLQQMRRVYDTKDLPFYEATEDTISAALVDMASEGKRSEYAARGMQHVRRYHDELPALSRLASLYRYAIEEQLA
jgi:hypothetical protein